MREEKSENANAGCLSILLIVLGTLLAMLVVSYGFLLTERNDYLHRLVSFNHARYVDDGQGLPKLVLDPIPDSSKTNK
jgi:hypothetical protein